MNIYDLGYSHHLDRNPPSENIEMKNSFSSGTSISSIGSLGDGKHLEDIGTAAYLQEEDIEIEDLINDRIDTSEAKILADWTFGQQGAFVVGTSNDGLSISPTGLLAKKAGETTFTITSDGDATYKGDLAASQITTGSLSVLRTEADVTADNPQNVAWLTDSGDMAYEDLVEKAKLGETVIDGGYLRADMLDTEVAYISDKAMIANATIDEAHIDSLSANDITSGTLSAIDIEGVNITGSTVRTSASGGRVVIDDVSDSINIYDSGGIRMSLQEETLTFLDPNGYSGAELSSASSNELWVRVGTDSYYFRVGNLNMGGSALSNVGNIGASYTRAGTIYGTDLDLSSDIEMNGNSITNVNTLEAGDAYMGIVDIDDLLVDDVLNMNGNIFMNNNNIEGAENIASSNVVVNDLYINITDLVQVDEDGYLYV